ncbi:MAG TPA: hydrogenase maturation peptidase HycI, partial [Atlantibacter hermannii]|nr:hydrogenase maturation peptidase HycI [Atlantibacter hermannii]
PMLGEKMLRDPVSGWTVVNGGSAPENVVHQVRALNPSRVVVVDATDMGLSPGEIRVVDPNDIADMFIVSTHTMPLTFLIDSLKDDVPEVTFIGIQPDIVAFYFPVTPAVCDAVERLYQHLENWQGPEGIEALVIEASEEI